MTLKAWLAVLLVGVVAVTETILFVYQVYETRRTAAAYTRDQSVMSLLWTARAIEDAPPEIQDKIPSGFAQPGRVLFLEDKSAIRPTDEPLETWTKRTAEWLRTLHHLDFRSFAIARRTVYLPPRVPQGALTDTPQLARLGVEDVRIQLPGFRDGRTPVWLLHDPDPATAEAEGYKPTPAFVYALELPDGRWLNMYALPVRVAKEGFALRLAIMVLASIGAVGVAIWLGSRLVRPLAELGDAAGAIGRGEPIPRVKVRGPRDVRRTIGDFNRMGERIAQANAYRAALLQSLGHDLRGPLAATRESLDSAEMNEADRAAVGERLAVADAILTPIVNFSQATLSDGPVEVTDLVALTEAAAETTSRAPDAITIEAPSELFVRARFNALERLVSNVIENAMKYAGGVHVEIAARPDAAVMRFLDRGPGIPPEEMESVFRPFYRLNQNRRDTEGFGLGLAIAKAIILDHGGTIELANRPGGGLVVEVQLPREDPPAVS